MLNNIIAIDCTSEETDKIKRNFPHHNIIILSYAKPRGEKNGAKNLNEYLPCTYEEDIIKRSLELYAEIRKMIPQDVVEKYLTIDSFDLLEIGKFHLVSKVFYPELWKSLIIENIRKEFNNELIIVGKSFSAAPNAKTDNIIFSGNKSSFSMFKILLFSSASVAYQLIYSHCVSRLFRSEGFDNDSALLLGGINEFLQFSAELQGELVGSGKQKISIVHPLRKYLQFKKLKNNYPANYHFILLERFIKSNEILKILIRYLTLTVVLLRRLKPLVDVNNSACKKDKEFLSKIIYFYQYFYLVSLKYYFATKRITKEYHKEKVILSYPHSIYINLANHIFMRNGFQTMTYHHGLIMNPNQMMSEAGEFYSMSKFDLDLMQKISFEKKFILIKKKNTIAKMKIYNSDNVLVLSSLFANHLSSNSYNQLVDRLVSIVAGCFNGATRIIVKPHPKENRFHLKKIVNKYQGVEVSENSMNELLSNSSLVISPMSTALLECISKSVPFVVFKTGYESEMTASQIVPEELVFTKKEDLTRIDGNLRKMTESQLSAIYMNIYNRYYYGEK